MEPEILQVKDLAIPKDFVKKPEETAELIEVCGICCNCCYSDCTGGN